MDDLIKELQNLKVNLFNDIMLTAKVEVENHIHDAFDNEGFTDKGLKKWQPVKRKKGGKILTDTEHLANTVKVTPIGSTLNISTVSYGKWHNEGTAKLPQRQFIGESDKMFESIGKEVTKLINKRLK